MCAQPSCCGCCDITKNYFLQHAFLREGSRGCKGRTFLIKLFPTLQYKVGEKSRGSLENISNDNVALPLIQQQNCLSCVLVWVVCASTYPQTVFPGVATRLLNSWWRREHIRHMRFFQPKKKKEMP